MTPSEKSYTDRSSHHCYWSLSVASARGLTSWPCERGDGRVEHACIAGVPLVVLTHDIAEGARKDALKG